MSDGMTFPTLDLADGEYTADDWTGMVLADEEALIAAAFPTKPPSVWFNNPKLTRLTPLTIEDDGRVFGHIASWHTSHIGMTGGIKAPKSRSNYAFFATGILDTDDGNKVNVGQITLTGGHAPLDGRLPDVVAHYDNTKSAVMDVSVGEDRHGIWVAGALRPDIDDLRLRAIRASSVSGDWRPINGHLELVAVCAVNVPGFPIPRARVAAGATMALVAAGTEQLVEAAIAERAHEEAEPEPVVASEVAVVEAEEAQVMEQDEPTDLIQEIIDVPPPPPPEPSRENNGYRDLVVVSEDVAAGLLSLDERIARIEAVLTDKVVDRRESIRGRIEEAITQSRMVSLPDPELGEEIPGTVETITPEPEEEPEAKPEDQIAILRSRVHKPVPATADSLRQRVHGRPAVKLEPEPEPEPEPVSEAEAESEAEPEAEPEVTAAVEPEVELWEDGYDMILTLDGVAAAATAVTGTATSTWNAKKRKQAASKGQAMKDGSFPIADCRDVEKAVHAMGRSKKSVATVKRHIVKRARSLGCTSHLPDTWGK